MKNIDNTENVIYVDRVNYSPISIVKQEDNLILVLELYKNGIELDLTGQTIELAAKRADNVVVQQTEGFTIDKNKVTVTLRNNIVAVVGIVQCELNIKDNAGAFTTSNFTIRIAEKILGEDSLNASDNIQALEKVKKDFVDSSNLLKDNFNKDSSNALQNFANTSSEDLKAFTDLAVSKIDKFDKESSSLINNVTNRATLEIDRFNENAEQQLTTNQEDYNSLKKVVIDENQAALLQNQININKKDIKEIKDLTPVEQNFIGTDGTLTIQDGFEGELKDLVVKGKTVGGWNAETQQSDTIVSSGEAEGNKIPIKSVGKNLLDVNKKENQTIGTLIYTDGTIYDSPNRDYYYTSWIKCEKATKYTVSGLNSKVRIVSYDSNKNFKSGGEYGTVSVVKGDYIRVGYIIAYMNNVMLEESTLATDYEPFVEDKKEVVLPFEGGLKGLEKVQDELKYSESKIVQRISKRAYKVGDEDNTSVLTDKINTLYVLDTPIIHNLSQLEPMKQYKGTTNILQENEIKGDISCKAKISLSAQATRLRIENERLIKNARETELDQEIQNGKITTTMLANTELFEIVIGLMPVSINTKNDKGGVSKMVEVYVTLIIQGDKTLDQVPLVIRAKVEEKLVILGVIK